MSEQPLTKITLPLTPMEPEPVPSIPQMVYAAVKGGLTKESAEAVKEMMALYERQQAKEAEKAFNSAFVKLQKEMPRIKATTIVPNNDGTPRYAFAKFEEIMEQVQPLLVVNGFTVSFSQKYAEGRVIETCTLRHEAGHSASNDFAARIGKGPPGSSETQADGSASSYAKRFALCNALNIVVKGLDNDARAEGATITEAQAKSLQARVIATKSNVDQFLKFAQVPLADTATPEDVTAAFLRIPSSMFPQLDKILKKKESK